MNFVVAVNNFGDTRSGGLAGPMGLFIIVLLCIATVLLIRNMNKRVRRLPDSFQDSETTRRRDEVTRLNNDLDAPAAPGGAAGFDHGRSAGAADAADAEVIDVRTAETSAGEQAKTDRD